jgi:hypothetical protein
MPNDEQQYITNTNDRLRIILYHYISAYRKLTFSEQFELMRLENIYVDNLRYISYLEDILSKRGFIHYKGTPSRQDDNGHWIIEDSPITWDVTELGEKALKSGLIPSETKTAFTNLLKEWVPIIASVIAVIISIWKS